MRIVTKRLCLRPLKMSDAKDITENINDLSVSKWLLVVPYPYTQKDAKDWIRDTRNKWKMKNKNDYTFGIELRKENKIIGGIGLHKINKFGGKAEIGYWIGKRYWKQGYGSEAVKAILDFAFKTLKLRRVEAGIFVGNLSSQKLFEKFGAKKEGLKRKSCRCKADGKIKDEYIYGLLKEEYKIKKCQKS